MKSSLKNMVLTLLIITGVSATTVGLVYRVTVEPIEVAKTAKITSSIAMVLPEFDNNPSDEKVVENVEGKDITVYKATKGGDIVGYAIETFSNNGFGGEIKVMVGFMADGTINKIETLSHNETPGLGDKMESGKSNFAEQFSGKNPADFKIKVRKDGGDVDAITASTISSRAFSDAVEKAYKVYQSVNK